MRGKGRAEGMEKAELEPRLDWTGQSTMFSKSRSVRSGHKE